MVNYLFIAEKPSLAKEIAEARAESKGVTASKNGTYWAVGDDAVTWLFGHMYETSPPEAYDPKYSQWSLDHLPIVPDKWKLNLDADKRDHVGKIKKLIKEANFVVNAGDAAREGQLLVDELLYENGWNPFSDKTFRLWVRSVARKDMLDALSKMEPNVNKKNLYNSAVCRQRADWLHGMNMSRLYTIKAQQSGARGVVSVGRVQTPTLKIVVDRDREIENFKPVDHYLPNGFFTHENGKFSASWIIPDDCNGLDSEGRLVDKSVSDAVAIRIKGKSGIISEYKSQDKSTPQPLPYSLSALQTECSAKFGLSAQETLEVAQKLYETYKVTTYPRSDCRYLPTSIYKDEAQSILKNLNSVSGMIGESSKNSQYSIKSAAWNDSKISDHHGIIPTYEASAKKIESLPHVERQVFDLIAKTFIAQFYPAHRYKSLSAIVSIEKDHFRATGKQVVDEGWKAVYGKDMKSDDEDEELGQTLPAMKKGDFVEVDSVSTVSKQTKPPARFSDGTLIAAMTNMHKFVSDPEIKKLLKENDGLGTEATRASIIEKLIERKFIDRKGKKQLISSVTGRSVIDALPNDITDPGLTAVWEGYLNKVSSGEVDPDKFMSGQIKTLNDRIERGKSAKVTIKGQNTIKPIEGHGDSCPKCSQGTLITREIRKGQSKGKKFLSCSKYPECDHVQWPTEKIEPIKGHGEQCSSCSQGKMVTKVINKGDHKGKKFLACDKYPECNNVVWPQADVKPIEGHGNECPSCKTGKLTTKVVSKGDNKGKSFLACNNYPECKHAEWPKPKSIDGHGKQYPKCNSGKLITRKSKTGKTFLSCETYPKCDHSEWPDDDVKKIKGDGDKCPSCESGVMVTKMIKSGDNKGKPFLACNAYPGCKNVIWPGNPPKKK